VLTPRALAAARRRVFHGWWMVAAAGLSQVLHASLLFLSQGLYLVELETTFRWSRGTISWAFGLIRIETGLLGPIQGWLVDRFGPRPVMWAGTLLFGGGFILLAQIQTLWQLFAVLGLIALGSSLAGFLTIHTALARWFVRRRTRALSLTSVGWAAGGLVAPLVGWSIAVHGWRDTAVVSGLLILLVGLPTAQLFRRRPEDHGLHPDGAAEPRASERRPQAPAPGTPADADFTLRAALRHRAFWYIALGHGTALLVVGTVPTHLVPHLAERNGWDPAVASLIFPGIMVAQIVGQIGGGILADLHSKRLVAAAAMVGHGGALVLMALTTTVAAVVVAVALHGLAWGARGPLMIAIRADYFGTRNLGVIAGWSSVITMAGSLLGPVYAGMMHDALGDYVTAFWTLGATTIVGAVFFLAARPPVASVGRTAAASGEPGRER
jgi:MFS family permease